MPGNLFAYSGGAKKTVTDPKIYTGGTRKDALVVYGYSGGLRKLSYWRTSVSLTATTVSSSQINLTWSAPSFPVANYILKRGGSQIYSGTGTAHNDTGLAASTGYSYTLDAYYNDGSASGLMESAAASATTQAPPIVDYYNEFAPVGVGAWSGSSWETQGGAGRLRQSNSSGNNYQGYWFWGQALKDAIHGSTITKADIRFTRQASGSGPGTAVTMRISLHTHTTRPASPDMGNGAYPWTYGIERGANLWIYGGGGGTGSLQTAIQHIASDIGGAWRGLKVGRDTLDANENYISAGSSATDAANDPGGTLRVWYRK